MAKSWQEQRQYTYTAIDALGSHPVVTEIKRELGEISAGWPDLKGE